MSEPFIGEIRMFGFNFPPKHWAQCDGQILEINQHPTLYALIGNTFGGNGQSTFALPDLRGRVPMHEGDGYFKGELGGLEGVVLTERQLPAHSHDVLGTSATGEVFAGGPTASLATSGDSGDPVYVAPSSLVDMGSKVIGKYDGGGNAHNNMQPTQVVNFCISLDGLFPPRS